MMLLSNTHELDATSIGISFQTISTKTLITDEARVHDVMCIE